MCLCFDACDCLSRADLSGNFWWNFFYGASFNMRHIIGFGHIATPHSIFHTATQSVAVRVLSSSMLPWLIGGKVQKAMLSKCTLDMADQSESGCKGIIQKNASVKGDGSVRQGERRRGYKSTRKTRPASTCSIGRRVGRGAFCTVSRDFKERDFKEKDFQGFSYVFIML